MPAVPDIRIHPDSQAGAEAAAAFVLEAGTEAVRANGRFFIALSGGTTPTFALLSNSAAVNAGNPALPGVGGDACEAKDQRGVSRPQSSRCDIGAFESTGPETIGNSGFHDAFDEHLYSWPAQAGVTQYQTRRSGSPTFAAPCVGIATAGTSWRDTDTPAQGAAFFYLNRPIEPQPGSWGWSSAGVERTTACP